MCSKCRILAANRVECSNGRAHRDQRRERIPTRDIHYYPLQLTSSRDWLGYPKQFQHLCEARTHPDIQ
jgi:hypothetical protein